MDLGTKLRQARLEAGLTQRALCGDTITRNMLSQIENGTARPSMQTLQILAQRLGKRVSYFLEEPADDLARAREAFAAGDMAAALSLSTGTEPEAKLMTALCCMALAEQAIREARLPYARQLLSQAGDAGSGCIYFDAAQQRRHQILTAQATGAPLTLPPDDRELLLRARDALDRGDAARAGQYLDAAEDPGDPQWSLLRGQAYYGRCAYAEAVPCFQQAEDAFPKRCAEYLEQCFEQLEDYKAAYHYARKLRGSER